MKPTKGMVIFVIGTLTGGIVWLCIGKGRAREDSENNEAIVAPKAAEVSALAPEVASVEGSHSINWRALAHNDLVTAAEMLRKADVPEEIVYDVIKGRVEREILGRRVAELTPGERFSYWKGARTSTDRLVMELEEFVRHPIRKEVLSGIEVALGSDRFHEPTHEVRRAVLEYKYPFLSFEKGEAVEIARQDFYDRKARLSIGFPAEASEFAEAERLQAKLEEQLVRMLTPEEKDAYDMHYSSIATGVRRELAGFAPSEEVFQRLYAIQSEYEGEVKRANSASGPPAKRGEILLAAREKMDEDLMAALGPERYDDYRREQDPYFRILTSFTDRRMVDSAIAKEVYTIRKSLESQVIKFLGSDVVPAEQKRVAMFRFKEQVQSRLEELLGRSALAEFKVHPAGAWVDEIYVSTSNPP